MGEETMPDVERLSRFLHIRVRPVRGFLILAAALLLVCLAGMSCEEGDDDDSSNDDADDSGGDDDDSAIADDTGVDDDDAVGGDGFHENMPPYSGWAAGWDGLLRFDQDSAEVVDYPAGLYRFISVSTYGDAAIAVGDSESVASEDATNNLWAWDGSVWATVALPVPECEPWSAGLFDAVTSLVACMFREESPDDDIDDEEPVGDFRFELWRGTNGIWEDEAMAVTDFAARIECHDGTCLWIAEESYFIAASGLTQIGSGSPLAGDTGYGDMVMASDALGLLRFMEDSGGERTAFLYDDGAYTDVNEIIEGLPHRFYGIFTGYVLNESTVAFSDTGYDTTYIYSPAEGWREKPDWPIVKRADFAVGEAVFAMTDDSLWIFYDGLWLRRPDVDFEVGAGEESVSLSVWF